jgi:hypothetical protein
MADVGLEGANIRQRSQRDTGVWAHAAVAMKAFILGSTSCFLISSSQMR